MSFKENLRRKIQVDRLIRQVMESFSHTPAGGGPIIDKTAMRMLLQTAGYESRTERETEMYARDLSLEKTEILVLDNELKIYDTNVADVLLRKNPLTKEMISFRNIRKILNDQDVVVAKGRESADKIRREYLEGLDLTYGPEDVEEIYADAVTAFDHNDSVALVEHLQLFAELLGLKHPPQQVRLRLPDLEIYGWETLEDDQAAYGPVYIYHRHENTLRKFDQVLGTALMYKADAYRELAYGKIKPELEDTAVLDDLRQKTLGLSRNRVPVED